MKHLPTSVSMGKHALSNGLKALLPRFPIRATDVVQR